MKIRQKREEQKLSQGKLAQLCGWDNRSRISNYERGEREPDYEDLAIIADVLKCPISELIDKENAVFKLATQHAIIDSMPILSILEISGWIRDPVLKATHRIVYMPQTINKPNKATFAFENTSNAMVNRINPELSLFAGELAIVDPEVLPKDCQLVLVQFGENDMRVRQYREDGALKFLHAFDPEIKSTELAGNIKIVGTLIGRHRNW